MIIKEIDEYEFKEVLTKDEYSSFSSAGASALYDYLLDFGESIGENIKFDVIAIRSEYTEYKTLDEILKEYSYHDDIKTVDDLRNYTSVIEFDKGYIIQEF
jgi:ABC-type proline/glycine betaine transport system substrate-binding protein